MYFDSVGPGSNRFINLAQITAATEQERWAFAALQTEVIGGPCTVWISNPTNRTTLPPYPLPFGPQVTLRVAPGCVLHLPQNALLTVQGRFEAEMGACLEMESGARVEFVGDQTAIDARWWRPVGTKHPIAFALDALWARMAHDGEGNHTVLPIEVVGVWETVSSTIRLERPPAITESVEVTLRGQEAQLLGDPDRAGPMLEVRDGVALICEGLSFTEIPSTQPRTALVILASAESGSRFTDCAFACLPGQMGVSVSPSSSLLKGVFAVLPISLAVAPLLLPASLHDEPRMVTFERCTFRGQEGAVLIGASPLVNAALRVYECQFGGRYTAAVRVITGDLLATGCLFHNQTVMDSASAGAGGDVVMGASGATLADTTASATVITEMLAAYDAALQPPNGQVTLIHCLSQSDRLLFQHRTWNAPNTLPPAATLTGVLHTPARADNLRAPAVVWDVDAKERALVLQSTSLGGHIALHGSARPPAGVQKWWAVCVGDLPPPPRQQLPTDWVLDLMQIERLSPPR